jgi:hypothetical protein
VGHETLRLPAFRFLLFVLPCFVIAGLDPAIHAAKTLRQNFGPALVPHFSMDHRVKPGGDEENAWCWQNSHAIAVRERDSISLIPA